MNLADLVNQSEALRVHCTSILRFEPKCSRCDPNSTGSNKRTLAFARPADRIRKKAGAALEGRP